MRILIRLITCMFLFHEALCGGSQRMYSGFVSPFGFGHGVPALVDTYPFIKSRMSAELTTESDDAGFPVSLNLNTDIASTSKLKLNFNRMGINRAGYTCGLPGTGEVDPFKLGAKYVMPDRRKAIKRRLRTFPFLETMEQNSNSSPEMRMLRKKRAIHTRIREIARPNEFCWQVKIRTDFGNGTTKLCGGTIIGSKTILTAAHCLVDRRRQKPVRPSAVTVQVGQDGNDEESSCVEIFLVDLILPHPAYDVSLEDNDIALLILNTEINFEQKSCACKLCVKDKEPAVGQHCVVAGDGKTREVNGLSSPASLKWHKQQILLQTFDSRCAFILNNGKFTKLDAFMCAGDINDDSSCQGDDGSAFVCFDQQSDSHYAAGIISFSAGCGKEIGSQYTKVKSYLNWIEQNAPEWDVNVQRGWNREIARNL